MIVKFFVILSEHSDKMALLQDEDVVQRALQWLGVEDVAPDEATAALHVSEYGLAPAAFRRLWNALDQTVLCAVLGITERTGRRRLSDNEGLRGAEAAVCYRIAIAIQAVARVFGDLERALKFFNDETLRLAATGSINAIETLAQRQNTSNHQTRERFAKMCVYLHDRLQLPEPFSVTAWSFDLHPGGLGSLTTTLLFHSERAESVVVGPVQLDIGLNELAQQSVYDALGAAIGRVRRRELIVI